MTMNAKELREAAELYLSGEGTSRQRFEAFEKMANYILANVQEDGEESPDENYLLTEWPWLGGSFDDSEAGYLHLEHDSLLGSLYLFLGKLRYAISVGNSIPVTTRSQFRSLMKGLGIEPKNKSQKTI